MMTQTCYPSSPEVEGEGVQGHSGLHSGVKATVRCVRLYHKQKKEGAHKLGDTTEVHQ